MKIFIYGTGSLSKFIINNIKDEVEIIGVVDEFSEEKIFQGFEIFKIKEILELNYDCIVIGSMYTKEIFNRLLDKGISFKKIIPYFKNIEIKDLGDESFSINKMIKSNSEKRKITLIENDSSSCNCRALYKNKNDNNEYEIELVKKNEIDYRKRYDIVISTHFEGVGIECNKYIELWHGFPLKQLGVGCKKENNMLNCKIDKVISYGNMYSLAMSSLHNIDYRKFIVTGMPRNDYLFKGDKEKIFEKIGVENKHKKVILFTPTFRTSKRAFHKLREEGKNLNDIDYRKINKFCEENNFLFIIKEHRFEINNIEKSNYGNIRILDDEFFINNNIDFYELVGLVDLLITDYSSIYFDFLLVNKPIIFFQYDYKEYSQNRGLIYNESLMPGIKCRDTSELINILNNESYKAKEYEVKRDFVRNLIHERSMDNYSENVWNIIMSFIKEDSDVKRIYKSI